MSEDIIERIEAVLDSPGLYIVEEDDERFERHQARAVLYELGLIDDVVEA